MIIVEGLQKQFKHHYALNGLNVHVKKGEIYGFIGKNGAGKTTAMNIFAGLSKPSKGKCIINGIDVSKIRNPGDLHIGYLPEEPRFYRWMTAREVLKYLSKRDCNVSEILNLVGLNEYSNNRVGGFSRGMKQRLGIGAVLVNDPELLILDEPSSALDPKGRIEILSLITRLKQMGKTILFSTHILDDVERVCDTVGYISEGKMILEKSLKHISEDNIKPIIDIVANDESKAQLLKTLNDIKGIVSIISKESLISIKIIDSSIYMLILKLIAELSIYVESIALRKSKIEDLFIQMEDVSEGRVI